MSDINTPEELQQRLEELEGEAAREVEHFKELDYPPMLIWEELNKRIGVDSDGWSVPAVFHPNSSEAKEIRQIGIDLGFYKDVTDEDHLGWTHSRKGRRATKPDFKQDGREYLGRKSYSQMRKELRGDE